MITKVISSILYIGSFHLLHILLEDYIVYCVELKATADQKPYAAEPMEIDKQTSAKQNGELYRLARYRNRAFVKTIVSGFCKHIQFIIQRI